MNILEKLQRGLLYFDGGFGSLLQARGLKSGTLPDMWNLDRPDDVKAAHLEYLRAGADVINTNTFGSLKTRLGDRLHDTVRAAVKIAREAVDEHGGGYVALDIGPTGRMFEPFGDMSFDEAVELFSETIRIGAEAGADLVNIETMSDIYEAKAALLAAKESCDLPVFISVAFNQGGKLLMGSDARIVAATLEALGADAVGLNCGLGPKEALPVVKTLSEHLSVPVVACPNAGLPRVCDGKTVYDVSPEDFAETMVALIENGARVIGGCCGTTPAHIKALRERTEGLSPVPLSDKNKTLVTSSTVVCELGNIPALVGERINPTGRSSIAAAMRAGNLDAVVCEATEQAGSGVHIIDVNAGLPDINEAEVLPALVSDIQMLCPTPLQIDTLDTAALDRALRIYNGRPIVNSVSGTEESMAAVFPIVTKYGAAVIALTLDENGVPKTAAERLAVAEKICTCAEKYGIRRCDIVFDPLVLAAATDKNAVRVTLETITLIKEKLGCKTLLGVSNVSYGLPERAALNAAMLTCCLERGADAVFINPDCDESMKAYRCFTALFGLDQISGADVSGTGLHKSIVLGQAQNAESDAKKLLESTAPLDIINDTIIPALDELGTGYEAGTVFLPQLLSGAEAAKAAFSVISARISAEGGEKISRGKIVIATVSGDVHDIGKNIVTALLENYGFDVCDLGTDVSAEDIAAAVIGKKADICGLSALMTTSVPAMRDTVNLLRERAPGCKIIVGGAVMTEEYAEILGADGYSKDAIGAVRLIERLLGR